LSRRAALVAARTARGACRGAHDFHRVGRANHRNFRKPTCAFDDARPPRPPRPRAPTPHAPRTAHPARPPRPTRFQPFACPKVPFCDKINRNH
jgi:hypothetical protein